MATSTVVLDKTQYVRVNIGLFPMILQSHRDEVRVVLNETQPNVNVTAFHLLDGSDDILHLNTVDTNVWALSITSTTSLTVTEATIPTPIGLNDAAGNPITSFSGAIDVNDPDPHHEPVNEFFHFHTAVTSTLAVAVPPGGNSYTLTLAGDAIALGFALENHIQIENGHVETSHPVIKGIAGVVLTLDRRIDAEYEAGTNVNVVRLNMKLAVGSISAPIEYIVAPDTDDAIIIHRLMFSITHGTAGDPGKFGDIAGGLDNGVTIRARINGHYLTFANWKTTGDMLSDMHDITFDQRSTGGGTYGTSGRWTLKNFDIGIRLDPATNDQLELYIQDDLTDLLTFEAKAQGHYENS